MIKKLLSGLFITGIALASMLARAETPAENPAKPPAKTSAETPAGVAKDDWLSKLKSVAPELICNAFIKDDKFSKQLADLKICKKLIFLGGTGPINPKHKPGSVTTISTYSFNLVRQ